MLKPYNRVRVLIQEREDGDSDIVLYDMIDKTIKYTNLYVKKESVEENEKWEEERFGVLGL